MFSYSLQNYIKQLLTIHLSYSFFTGLNLCAIFNALETISVLSFSFIGHMRFSTQRLNLQHEQMSKLQYVIAGQICIIREKGRQRKKIVNSF